MAGLNDLPVEVRTTPQSCLIGTLNPPFPQLLYEIHLQSLSSALPVVSRYFRSVFAATSPFHRAEYLYLRHDRKTLAHAVKYGICDLKVVHVLERQAKTRGKKLKCPQLPRRLFKGVGHAKDKSAVDLPLISYLLAEYEASPNSHDGYPLARAVFARHLPLIKLLLEYGADPGLKDGWAVTTAISNGDHDLVKMLVEREVERDEPTVEADVLVPTTGSGPGKKRRRVSGGGGGKRRKIGDRCLATSVMLETAVRSKQWAIVDYLTAKGEVTLVLRFPSRMLTRPFPSAGARPSLNVLTML